MCIDEFDKDGIPLKNNLYGVEEGNGRKKEFRTFDLSFMACVPK